MACKGKKGRMRIPKRKMSVGGILSTTAGMAGTGSMFGPVGTGVGAALGLGMGVYQHIQEQDQERKQDEMLQKQSRLKNIYDTTDFSYAKPMELMPYGGSVGSETVELEQGEVYKTPDGQLHSISTQAPSHAQGGVTLNLPGGTKVLGKKELMKQGKQFKTLGRKLDRTQEKYLNSLENNPTSISTTTAKRMLTNVQKEFDTLFSLQGEDVGTPMMPYGGVVGDNKPVTTQRGVSAPSYRDITPITFEQQLMRKNIIKPGYDTLSVPELNNMIRTGYNIPEGYALPYQAVENNGKRIYQKDFGRNAGEFYSPDGSGEVIGTYDKPRETYADGGTIPSGADYFKQHPTLLKPFQERYGIDPYPNYGPKTQAAWGQYGQDFMSNYKTEPLQSITTLQAIEPLRANPNTTPLAGPYNKVNALPQKKSVNWGQIGNTIGALAPTMYNLVEGMQGAEQMNPQDFYNPYEGQVRRTMANRRYNINPELEQNRLNQATYYRNLAEAAPSQAQMLGGMQAGSIAKQRADSAAIAMKQNVDNQYLGDQAQTDTQLGATRAQTNMGVYDMNARARAASRGMTGAGLTQLSQFTQTKELMNNQILRDAQRMGLLEDLIANYRFEGGNWTFKSTGEKVSPEKVRNDMMTYTKGR